jgi:uncharacterized protein (TIGR02569 family)
MPPKSEATAPSLQVQRGFGAVGPADRFTSGQGTAFRVGDVVFKPVTDRSEGERIGDLLEHLAPTNVRVARPIRAAQGGWVFEDWTAWEFVQGQATRAQWGEVTIAGNEFHRALHGIARPDFMDDRTHQWAVGDRVAFGEQNVAIPAPISEQVARLRECLTDNRLASQVIHADLTENVLLSDDLPPAIIDFSPFYRPLGFAAAVTVVDAIVWFGASFEHIELIEPGEWRYDLLARALIFRLVAAALKPGVDADRLQLHSLAHAPLTQRTVEKLRSE